MAGTSWPDLIAGRTAKASEVESKFDWLEQGIVPMNSGTTTDLAYDLGTVAARWRTAYVGSLNATSTAGGVAIGTTTAHASTILDLSGVKAFRVPRLSSTERDALTGADGMLIFNSSTSQLQVYRNAAWGNIGGTVFRTYHTSGAYSGGATSTVVNIASGGGRINAIRSVGGANVTGATPISMSVILDGTTIFSGITNSTTTDAHWINADAVVSGDLNTTTAAGGMGSINWDFATSCAIHISGAAGVASTYKITVSKIV